MNRLFLFGKKYMDTIMFVDGIKTAETNNLYDVTEKIGGFYNFYEVDIKPWKISPIFSGTKKAFIVSDKSLSQRTSYVFDHTPCCISEAAIKVINSDSDWLHVCYIDDAECYSDLSKITTSYSLDFCTDKPREPYFNIMNGAQILFDSRERKHLYKNMYLNTPLILHDEFGIEIIKDGEVIFEEKNEPLKDLNVNGAGDMFAALFIKNYHSLGLTESAKNAMVETTNLLFKRKNNE